MLEELLRKEYDKYIEDMAEDFAGDYNLDIDEVIYDDDFIDEVEKDLIEVGFTNSEASGIAIGQFANETVMYKMLAYCFLSQATFTDVESLKSVINDSNASDLSEYTDDILEKIVEASRKIKS